MHIRISLARLYISCLFACKSKCVSTFKTKLIRRCFFLHTHITASSIDISSPHVHFLSLQYLNRRLSHVTC
ncbi:hypothetical protein F4810DRAFT_649994 [Camillea tinctor]|nr:hypothetical protein F4810DRAFT_649994 [Camillea tinctor]